MNAMNFWSLRQISVFVHIFITGKDKIAEKRTWNSVAGSSPDDRSWTETSDTVSRDFQFQPHGQVPTVLLMKVILDTHNFERYNTFRVQHYPFYQLSRCYLLQD